MGCIWATLEYVRRTPYSVYDIRGTPCMYGIFRIRPVHRMYPSHGLPEDSLSAPCTLHTWLEYTLCSPPC